LKTCLFGVDGLLGSQWVDSLIQLNHEVVGVGPGAKASNSKFDSKIKYYSIDLSKEESESLKHVFNVEKPDNVIVNSGLDARPGTGQSQLSQYSLNSWKEIFEVNLFGLVRILNTAVENSTPPRNIIIIGSMYTEKSPNPHMYSHYAPNGLTKHPAYSASKFGALSIVKQYASHYAPSKIYINMISPGVVMSNQDSEFTEKITKRIPLERLSDPSEFHSLLEYLLEGNSYSIGQNFVVDGGMNLW
jgi:NAD(P)-dependent dehydrogenase (short-subunit alcohol dehydrogenase family)